MPRRSHRRHSDAIRLLSRSLPRSAAHRIGSGNGSAPLSSGIDPGDAPGFAGANPREEVHAPYARPSESHSARTHMGRRPMGTAHTSKPPRTNEERPYVPARPARRIGPDRTEASPTGAPAPPDAPGASLASASFGRNRGWARSDACVTGARSSSNPPRFRCVRLLWTGVHGLLPIPKRYRQAMPVPPSPQYGLWCDAPWAEPIGPWAAPISSPILR